MDQSIKLGKIGLERSVRLSYTKVFYSFLCFRLDTAYNPVVAKNSEPSESGSVKDKPKRTVCCCGWKSMLITLEPWLRTRTTVFGRSSGEYILGGCVEPEKDTYEKYFCQI